MNFPRLENLKMTIKLPQFSREDFILLGIAVVTILTVGLLILDGYVFYRIFRDERVKTPAGEITDISFGEIDQVIRVLNERERRFKELLENPKKPLETLGDGVSK